MATFIERVRAGLEVFRQGFPQARLTERKGAPFMVWPDWRNSQADWRMVDLETYLEEGYNLNALIYGAVMYKARAASTPPLRAYSGDPDSPELLPPDHPLSKLVSRPSPSQSWREFQMLRTIFFNVAGESFVWLDRKGGDRGVPAALYVLNPSRVRIVPDRKNGRGVIGYIYIPEGRGVSDGYPLVAEDVIHTKLPNPSDPLDGEGYGFSPLSPLARSGDVDNMITKFLQIFFERGAVVTGLLKFERAMNDATVAQVRERWKQIYGGFENWTEVGVLDQGGDYQQISMTFKDMGFSELDERNESRILGPFGVPPILIGSRIGLLRSTYANYAEARTAFWEDTMLSELGLFEDDYRYYLQSEDGGFVQFDYSDVPALRKDISAQVTAWAALVDRGVPKNDAAHVVGLNLPDLPDGQVIYMPANLSPVDAEGNSTRPVPEALQPFVEPAAPPAETPAAENNDGAVEAEEDTRETTGKGLKAHKAGWTTEQKASHWKAVDKIAQSYEPRFSNAAADAFENDRRAILAILNGGKSKALQRKATINWEEIAGEVADYLKGASQAMWRRLFTPLIRGVVEAQGKRWSTNLEMQFDVANLDAADWFSKYTLKFAQPIGQTTTDDIAEIMARAQLDGASVPQVQKQLDALFNRYAENATPDDLDWKWFTDRAPAYRKEAIARTETLRASNSGTNEIFREWNVGQKEWLSTPDDRTRTYAKGDEFDHLEANGQVVGMDEMFTVSGEELEYPGDPNGSPGNTINCRCTLLPVLPEES